MSPGAKANDGAPGDDRRDRRRRGPVAFGLLWFGQLVSLVGSGLTRFALGVWVYERTGSVTEFALIAVAAVVPGLLIAPLAGALVDRWSRRRVLILSNVGAALVTGAIALLLWSGSIETWHVYIAVGIGSLFDTFHWPAYIAATTLLLPKRHLSRASGMMQFGQAAAGVVAPVTAGFLIAYIGMTGVILVDFVTFLLAMVTLLVIHIQRPPASDAGRASHGALWQEALAGWTFIRARPGLLGLLLYFAQMNLVFSLATVLVTPLVLVSFSSRALLGTLLAASSAGLLTGSTIMALTGGPRRRIHGVLGGGMLFGLALGFVGLRPWAPLIGGALFAAMIGAPIINGCSQAIWQTKVPADMQGRVFAVRRMIAQFTAPIGFLLAGPLADGLFEPLLAAGGGLAGTAGRVVGVGPGRGIGLIYLGLAMVSLASSVWGYAQPRVRDIEDELPDQVGATPG